MKTQINTKEINWNSLAEKEDYTVSINGFNSLSKEHLRTVIEAGLRGQDSLPRNYHDDDLYSLLSYVYKQVDEPTRYRFESILKESLQNLIFGRSELERQLEEDMQLTGYRSRSYSNNLGMLILSTIPTEASKYTVNWMRNNTDFVLSKLDDEKWGAFTYNMLGISLHHQPPLSREFWEPFLFNYPGYATEGMFRISAEEGLYAFDRLLKMGFEKRKLEEQMRGIMPWLLEKYKPEVIKKVIDKNKDKIDKSISDYLINWLKEDEL